jgi:hypothetical protein
MGHILWVNELDRVHACGDVGSEFISEASDFIKFAAGTELELDIF